MARLRFRSPYNNKWLDACNHQIFIRSPDNRTWYQLDPKRASVRDGGNLNWLELDCNPDPLFDEPCAFKDIASVNCPSGTPTIELGSGDGTGSNGPQFNLVNGYPAGYDLPDAGSSGFFLDTLISSAKGLAIKRPALNFALESYDPSGTTSNLGRGTYDNPNYLWATTFSSGCAITETIYDLGLVAGWYEIPFACYHPEGISVDVYYLGRRIATTCGRIKDRYKIEFFFDPSAGSGESRIMIRVRGEESTRWSLMVIGPKQNLSVYNLDWTDLTQALAIRQDEYNGTPIFPAPCHATVFPRTYKTNDGKWFYEFHHYVGENADPTEIARMVLDYSSWMNHDKFEIYHGGLRIGSTMDPTTLLGMIEFLWEPNRFVIPVPDLMIRVSAENREYGQDIMSWYYTLFCQNTAGYRANPWPCETPIAGLSSMGHSSTEDNYNMDNGVQKGVVSVKVIPYGDFNYSVSIFDIDQNLISYTEASKTAFIQFFIFKDQHGNSRNRITVRIDAPLGSSWTYFVGCPVELIDIEIDDKVVPVCDGDVEISIQNLSIQKNTTGKFTLNTNIPVPSDLTINVATSDGTALSALGAANYGGLPNIYGIFNDVDSISDGATVATKSGRFLIQNFPTASVIFDNGWGNLANPEYKGKTLGSNTRFAENILTSTFANLSPDARVLINSWKHRLGDLSGKRWLILTDTSDSLSDFSVICSNFIQSMINIYGLTVQVVKDDYSNLPALYDILTIANSKKWADVGKYSSGGVHYINRVLQGYKSPVAIGIATQIKQNKVFHAYFKNSANRLSENIFIRDVMNCFTGVKLQWNEQVSKSLSVPSVSLNVHTQQFPDTPLTNGITEQKLDTDFSVIDMRYDTVVNLDPDYEARSGTVVIPAGQSSGTFDVRTLDPAANPVGKFFFLDLLTSSYGDIVEEQGKATIINSTAPNPVTDVHFTKTSYAAMTWTSDAGCSVVFGVDSANLDLGDMIGSLAAGEFDSNPSGNFNNARYYKVGSYKNDSTLTYECKWEYVVKVKDYAANLVFLPTSITSFQPISSNKRFIVSMNVPAGTEVDQTAIVEANLIIKDSLGRISKSNTVTIVLTYVVPGWGGGGDTGPSGIVF
jgi:hypothetical protein